MLKCNCTKEKTTTATTAVATTAAATTTMLIAALCSCMSSCSDRYTNEPAGERLVTLKLALPQDENNDLIPPASRGGIAVLSETEESRITSLKFFVFDAENDNALELYKEIAIDRDGTNPDPTWDPVDRTFRIAVVPGSKRIYCLANWTDDESGMHQITDDVVTLPELIGQKRIHENYALTNPPVMTGYLETDIAGDEEIFTVFLTRQVARVTLAFRLSEMLETLGVDVRITGVAFVKLPSASYVFPQSPACSPLGVNTWGQSGFSEAFSDALTTVEMPCGTAYYIPEYYPEETKKATLMVIKAIYNEAPTFYSIRINPAESLEGVYTPYAIERNHTYHYTVTVEGAGSPAIPFRHPDAGKSNIRYEIETK